MAALLAAALPQSVTQSHYMTPFYTILFSSQLILYRGQTSRHFPVPDLFFNILDEISLHTMGGVLGCREKNTYTLRQEIPVTSNGLVGKENSLLIWKVNFLKTVLTDSLKKTRDPED